VGRILLIEDDPGAQLLYGNRLQELGHEVAVAANGALGLMEARSAKFDLFLVDIGLGSGIDGYEVCRRLKGIPQIHAVPVVLISGRVQSHEGLHVGYAAGCEAFLVKGDMSLLEDVVRAMLRIKSLQDDLALQNHLLEERNRHLQIERERGADLERALRDSGNRAPAARDLPAGLPDGVLLVDGEGIVRTSDRGAKDLLGKEIVGKHLATLVPGSSLEAFVRNARSERHETLRFDLGDRVKGPVRSFTAAVIPTVPSSLGREFDRVVVLYDTTKRRIASELLCLDGRAVERRELGPLLEAAHSVFHPGALLGESAVVRDLRAAVERLCASSQPVLLRGPIGCGKGLIGRILHYSGSASGPFLPVRIPAIAPGRLDLELYGQARPAGVELAPDGPGLVQQAHCGTLYLDEVGELPLSTQEKLLALLNERLATRIGSTQAERVDLRLVASTTVDLSELVAQGRFRAELLARLSEAEIRVPSLAEREEDVPLLAEAFLARYGAARGLCFSSEVRALLVQYDWPGNVGELERCVEDACAAAREGEIRVEHLTASLQELDRRTRRDAIPATSPRRDKGRPERTGLTADTLADATVLDGIPSLESYEKLAILHALKCTQGDNLAAAKLLNIGKSTFYRKLKLHGLSPN
jgi:DNA-binding NtrC family response regulator